MFELREIFNIKWQWNKAIVVVVHAKEEKFSIRQILLPIRYYVTWVKVKTIVILGLLSAGI